jgi:hypothetical protein
VTVVLAAVPDDLAAAAVDYARTGLEVFPVNANTKAPLVSQHEATTDVATVESWWRLWPGALVGHRVAPDIVILDVDTRHGGLKTWVALRTANGALPTTRTHYSGRGDKGGHIWFRRPAGKLSEGPMHQWAKEHGTGQAAGKHSWVSGIDLLRHEHRYSILPPSPHPDTHKPYYWAEGRGREVEPIAMPAWLVALVTEPPAPPRSALELVPTRQVDDDSIADWFSETFSWADLLSPEGWTLVKGDGDSDGSAWRHPNATAAQSATVRHECLFVYTPNTDFEVTSSGDNHGYKRFRAYAVLAHGGDMSEAAREARRIKGDGGNMDLPATLTGGVGAEPAPQPQLEPETGLVPVDWRDLFTREHKGEDWLLRPVVAMGRQAAVWAVHKTGKSLFSLDVAARAALGHPYLPNEPTDPTDVIYLDMEMTEDDLQERMSDFGYGLDDVDQLQRHLHYYLLPNLPPLDSPAGAAVLCDLVKHHGARLVVIDTMARAVAGEENSADTYRDFYRHTGAALKRLGVALLRLDHAGKDPTKGQRGSSSKGDDVDVVYQLERTDAGYKLITTAARMGWVPRSSTFLQSNDPVLSFDLAVGEMAWPAGTKELADDLDNLAGTAELSERDARALLKANDQTAANDKLRAALRFRRDRLDALPAVGE